MFFILFGFFRYENYCLLITNLQLQAYWLQVYWLQPTL
jgi:hypothetical protein